MGVRLPFRNQCSENWKQKYIEGWIDGYLVGFSGQLGRQETFYIRKTTKDRQRREETGNKTRNDELGVGLIFSNQRGKG